MKRNNLVIFVLACAVFCAVLAFCVGTRTMDIIGAFWLMLTLMVHGFTYVPKNSQQQVGQWFEILGGLTGAIACFITLISL